MLVCFIAVNFTTVHSDLRAGICFDRTGVAVCLGVVTDRCAIYHKGAILTNRNSAAMTGIGTYIVLQHNTATQCNMTTRSPLITRIDQRRGRRNTAVCRASFENDVLCSAPNGTAVKGHIIEVCLCSTVCTDKCFGGGGSYDTAAGYTAAQIQRTADIKITALSANFMSV